MDMRGHGHNHGWSGELSVDLLADDLLRVVSAIAEDRADRPLVGVFHSMAGSIGLKVACDSPTSFAGLVLFEAPLTPKEEDDPGGNFVAAARRVHASTMRRRDRFESPDELARKLMASPGTAEIPDQNALTLARELLIERPDGWYLRCRPELEAGLYLLNNDLNLWDDARDLSAFGLVQSGRGPHLPTDYAVAIAGKVAQHCGFDRIELGPSSHFGWLVEPAEWAAVTSAFINVRLGG